MMQKRTAPLREVVATPEAGLVFRLEYCDVRFWYPWHFHPEIEIKHVVRGSGTRIIGDSVETFTDGDLCIVGSGTPHCWSSKAERGRWIRAKVVQLHPELFATSAGGFEAFETLLESARGGLQLLGPERTEAASELSRLFEARSTARQLAHLVTFFAIASDSRNTRILSTLAQPGPGDTTRHRLAQQVLDFLKDRIHLPLTEQATAREFGLSPSAFSRLFTREFGKSFSRYVILLRVARASNLLLSEPLEVREIAQLAGFGTVASLNRHFRAVKMTTPTAYRRRGRDLNTGLRAAEGQLLRCDGAGRRPTAVRG
jgi:AraC-like DNA-binding protein